jgi:hypothetical protein
MRDLKDKTDEESKQMLKDVTSAIADRADTNFKKLKEELSKIKTNAGLNPKQLWKLRKKMCPMNRDPPTAMEDKHKNLLTSDEAIKNRALEVFAERLENNIMKPHLKDLEDDTNVLCEIRLKLAKSNETEPWTLDDLEYALKQLANGKSRDAEGFANEIFKVAGDDLKMAVLKLMNLMKKKQQYPKNLQRCNITTIHKKKSKSDLCNYRGVFRVHVLRSILDRLTYNDLYYTIDNTLTDGNVGARKHRSVRDNIFVISAITNSVINGDSPAIQVQVLDQKTCFDKLWLQACVNSLYEAGINNDKLNLLYIENKNAQIAVKVNNQLTTRINVKDVVMQGSVWGSLKCTTNMDKLNKITMSDTQLQYKYKGDSNIPIGVLGMVDDTLGVSECGNDSIKKNAAINSFVETQRQELSQEKSVVVHIGRKKCTLPCPTLKVHNDPMDKSDCTKYLGNYISHKGGVSDTVEDRRKKGWGKVSQIMAILGEVDMGSNRLEAGLMLRESILINSLLFSAEAWSAVSEKQLARLEVVDTSLLRQLTGNGHSKCPTEFHHLETGTLKLRHILTYRRLMFHHEILSRDNDETIKKIYLKQKQHSVKGDWIRLLEKDFDFIGIQMKEEEIEATPKSQYKKHIKALINKAAFTYLNELKLTHKKLDKVTYSELKVQPYLVSNLLGNTEKTLLYSLRSHCHKSKFNFRKLHKNDLFCTMGCSEIEDQSHIFSKCIPVRSKIKNYEPVTYENIFGPLYEQANTISSLLKIETTRNHLKTHLSPGGVCQDLCKFSF